MDIPARLPTYFFTKEWQLEHEFSESSFAGILKKKFFVLPQVQVWRV
jgi:hypothetical protein